MMQIMRTGSCAVAQQWEQEGMRGLERIIIVISEKPCVWTGKLPTFDSKYCEEHDIPVAYGDYLGGSIVCGAGDLSIMEIRWAEGRFAEDVMWRTMRWFESLGLNAEYDGNDILVDGKKVVSWARARSINGFVQSMVHFSIDTDLELIKMICRKEMEKTPGALSDYGITAAMIEEAIGPWA